MNPPLDALRSRLQCLRNGLATAMAKKQRNYALFFASCQRF
jgi:hypothetical protein